MGRCKQRVKDHQKGEERTNMKLTGRLRTLVSAAWLREQLGRQAKGQIESTSLRVLDTSWAMQPQIDSYQAFYQEAHIPSSLYFSLPKVHGHGVKSGPKYPI